MYVVNKIVGVMMSPSVLLLLVCIACAWKLSKRKSTHHCRPLPSTSTCFLWLALALLWFWMSALPARILGLPLEREWLVNGEIPTAESFPKADAIVCLGGGMAVATNVVHGANICPASDRVWMAAQLWHKQGERRREKGESTEVRIFVTGRGGEASTKKLLTDFGVPENAITFLEDARNTEEEARAIATSLPSASRTERTSAERKSERRDTAYSRRDPEEELPSARVLVVTSAWHMRRAKLMFEKYAKGVEVIPAPTDFEATIGFDNGFDFRELQPGTSFMNEVYLREWIGYFGYKWLR